MRSFLRLITYVFQPILMPTLCMLLVLQLNLFSNLPTSYTFLALAGTVLFTIILPALPIFYMLKKGTVSDFFISKKEERTIPYLFALLNYILWLIFIVKMLHFPIEFTLIAMGSFLSIIGLVVVNLKWKMSAHMAGVGGLLGSIVAISYLMHINPINVIIASVIITALVAISRVELKAHTPWQIVAGFIWGLICCVLPITLFTIL